MALISLQELTQSYVGPPLLDHIDYQIEVGDRIGLLGRNGAGKSTLLKLLAGKLTPDFGAINTSPGTKIAMLDQDVPLDITGSIVEIVREGAKVDSDEEQEDWQIECQVDQILSRMQLNPETRFESLSSGMKRRVLLARALAVKPDFLLLDEPTNHLDLEAILWLEEFLQQHVSSFMFVTHDRMFLRRMANRILEIDRGRIFDWTCNYDQFLVRKEQVLAAEEKEQALFDKRLAAEEVWIRKGIKARRTRNEGRVRALESMRVERSQRREKIGTTNLQIQEGQKSGNLVIGLDNISFSYQGHPVIRNFSTVVMRGDKVGIIGANGAGKSTLLKLMLGKLQPTKGAVKLGTNLQVAYFDQLREQLNPNDTVQNNVGDGYDMIQLEGGKKHVLGYLQDFLFTPERARTQVKFLSGGEKNRLLLAKLFAKPANIIVLDEPTNDLDAETLEMLEERITQFSGTMITVSHDRTFLNNVVSSVISFEAGDVREYVGGYDDWQRQFNQKQDRLKTNQQNTEKERLSAQDASSTSSLTVEKTDPTRRLKYKERLELEQLPGEIEKLESEIDRINRLIGDPEFYRRPKQEIVSLRQELETSQAQLTAAYSRWDELDAKAQS
jgi:ABC transport system ATP-binding/permease protein